PPEHEVEGEMAPVAQEKGNELAEVAGAAQSAAEAVQCEQDDDRLGSARLWVGSKPRPARRRLVAAAVGSSTLLVAGLVLAGLMFVKQVEPGPASASAETAAAPTSVEPPAPSVDEPMQAEAADRLSTPSQSPVEVKTAPAPEELWPAMTSVVTDMIPGEWLEPAPVLAQAVREPTAPPLPLPKRRTSAAKQSAPPQAKAPAVHYVDPPPDYKLTGVLRGPGGYLAIINGKTVRVGGMVAEARVVRITAGAAEMEIHGGRFTLGLGLGPIKAAIPPASQPATEERTEANGGNLPEP
ncbi:MAG: hypothetical protein KAU28_00590, partial [Phycisphaerae bacterium]|nr:hypothetical protein [Phycisphaerae bacterium]